MKKLLLISTFVLTIVSCAPSPAGTQTTPPVSVATSPVANATDSPTTIVIGPSLQPTVEPGQPPAITHVIPSTALSQAPISTTEGFPVTGSVVIAGGTCCIGGVEGDTLQAQVTFSAASPFGNVNRMRVKGECFEEAELEHVDWEPLLESKTFPVYVVINWRGFYVCAQYQDEHGNLSPIYRDDISVEGFPRGPLVNPTDWYPQIQCFSENEVQPGPGEVMASADVTFQWPDKNHLPDGVFYKVYVYGVGTNPTGLAASGQTRETSITLSIPPEAAGELGWYVILVDANGTLLDHAQCSSFAASLLTVDPPEGLKAVRFWYQP